MLYILNPSNRRTLKIGQNAFTTADNKHALKNNRRFFKYRQKMSAV